MFAVDNRNKILTLAAMSLGMFLVQLDLTIVNVALPSIQAHLGASVAGLQWVVDAYALVFAGLLLSGGGLGDLYGRKRLFLIGLVVFTLGCILCGAALTLGVLIAGRAIQGLGSALQLPGSLSILSTTFPDPKERAQAVGLWAGISGLALIAGPALGGVLVDTFGWPSVFYVNVPAAVVAFLLTWRVVRESANPEGQRLDWPGQVLSTLFLVTLVYALIEGNARGWGSPLIVGSLAAAAVSLGVFLVVETRSPSPLLQQVQRYSASDAGLRLLPLTGALIVGSPLAGRLAGRFGPRPPAVGVQRLPARTGSP